MTERHGTQYAYRTGCRCDACKAYKAEENKKYRRKPDPAPAPGVKHGVARYRKGCRCDSCKAAVKEYGQRYKQGKIDGTLKQHMKEMEKVSIKKRLAGMIFETQFPSFGDEGYGEYENHKYYPDEDCECYHCTRWKASLLG